MTLRRALHFFLIFLPCSVVLSEAQSSDRVLSILTYDSFMAKGGIGPELMAAFEKECHCRLKIQVAGDATQIVSRLELERLRNRAETQVVIGIDQVLWPQVRASALKWTAEAEFEHTVELGFTPLDYGIMGWIWNPEWKGFHGSPPAAPTRWSDLLDLQWKKLLLLQDPRTSTPGLGFVLGALAVQGNSAGGFFRSMRQQWRTLATGWSGSYELFLKQEAPLVWSYTTSQAYHVSLDPRSPLRALVFNDGNPIQIEGSFIVEKAVDDPEVRRLAKQLIQLLSSKETQQRIPKTQWMFPAIKGVPLPVEFRSIPSPKKILSFPSGVDLRRVLREWEISIR